MRLFKPLYEIALRWAAHPRAQSYLAGLSFVEAFIFPIAPEFMLAPMTLAKPARWARYASISLAFSLLGSLVGYALGHYAFDALRPVLAGSGLLAHLDQLVVEFRADAIAQLMCQGRLDIAAFEARHGLDFQLYFDAGLRHLRKLARDDLVEITPQALHVTARGRYLLRHIAMCFDAHLAREAAPAVRYSRVL